MPWIPTAYCPRAGTASGPSICGRPKHETFPRFSCAGGDFDFHRTNGARPGSVENFIMDTDNYAERGRAARLRPIPELLLDVPRRGTGQARNDGAAGEIQGRGTGAAR